MVVTTYTNFGGRIVSENRNGVKSDYVADTLGNTAALVNSIGVTDTWSYWPYGEVAARTGTNPTSFTYVGTQGYRLDVMNGLEYVKARHFRPGSARWQTVDPLWPAEPAYVYVWSSPAVWTDPTGRSAGAVGGLLIGLGEGAGECGGAAVGGCAAGVAATCGLIYSISEWAIQMARTTSGSRTDTRWRQKFPQFSDCRDLFDSCNSAGIHKPNSWQQWQWYEYCYGCYKKCLSGGGLGQALATGCSFWIVIRDKLSTAHDPL